MVHDFFLIDLEGVVWRVHAEGRTPAEVGAEDRRYIAGAIARGVTNGRGASWDDDSRVLEWRAEVAS